MSLQRISEFAENQGGGMQFLLLKKPKALLGLHPEVFA